MYIHAFYIVFFFQPLGNFTFENVPCKKNYTIQVSIEIFNLTFFKIFI